MIILSVRTASRALSCSFATALACVTLAPVALARDQPATTDPTTWVNTFIGTRGDGNTFPGASAPFGMIQVSPITEHYAGYRYDHPRIRGFGHSFLSGAGCWEQGGQLSVLPVTGTIGPGGQFDIKKAESFDHKKYAAAYTHDGEAGQAGYYRTRLTDYGGIDVELTALTRAAAERYTFLPGATLGHVLVNTGQAAERHGVVGSSVQVVGDRAVEGKIVTKSFCGGQQYTTFFRMEFDRPFKSFGTWSETGGVAGGRGAMQGDARPAGAWVTFDLADGRTVSAISAISLVDLDGARRNLDAEGKHNGELLTFEAMRRRVQDVWRGELQSVRVGGGTDEDRVVFYTAVYHALLQPHTGSDVDGRYRGFDDQIHTAEGFSYYQYFSLWDTYRSQNQLIALIRPQRARDIATTLLKMSEHNGWLPRWTYANFDANVMTGDPITPFLVDLWRFDALEHKEEQAFTALRQNAYGMPPPLVRSQGRAGNPSYLTRGFVQYDRAFPAKSMDVDVHHGGSATFEYALADCALSLMADALGKRDDATTLRARGRNWRKVWDPEVVDTELGFKGFPRPRLDDGDWYAEADGSYSPRSHHGFHEGTAWQYQWLTQQDVPGLIEAVGGHENAITRLDAFFAYDKLMQDPLNAARKHWVVGPYSYYNQYRYNPNNEPDLHAPWMYTLMGRPWKTATVLRAAQSLFTSAPDGVTGNDDLGTMSAWYLFSAIGLYPAVPGTGQFLLHTPRFERIELDLNEGRVLTIEAPRADGRKLQYVAGVLLAGKPHRRVWVDWEQLRRGGTIVFSLAQRPPADGWGTTDSAKPRSPCADSRPGAFAISAISSD